METLLVGLLIGVSLAMGIGLAWITKEIWKIGLAMYSIRRETKHAIEQMMREQLPSHLKFKGEVRENGEKYAVISFDGKQWMTLDHSGFLQPAEEVYGHGFLDGIPGVRLFRQYTSEHGIIDLNNLTVEESNVIRAAELELLRRGRET